MDTKEIYVVTHIDFDGAVSPFILYKLTSAFEKINNIKYNIVVKYCDFFNAESVIYEFIKKIEQSSVINNNFLLITDIVYVTKEMAEKINQLYLKGLNVLYIDHHFSEQMEEINNNFEWVYYCKQKNKCASMQFFLLLLSCFLNKVDNIGHEQIEELLNIKNNYISVFIKENLKTLNSNKYLKQCNFFDVLFNLNCKYNIEHQVISLLRDIITNFFKLVWAANLIDCKQVMKMKGLSEVLKYWDISNEYSNKSRMQILDKIAEIINALPQSLNLIIPLNEKLEKCTKLNERIEESIYTVSYFNVYDKHGNIYTIAACFGEGDICFTVDDFRLNMNKIFQKQCINPFNIDLFISFSRSSVSKTPVYHIRPMKFQDAYEFAKLVKRDDICISGTKIGAKGIYSKNVYLKLTNLRKIIVNSFNDSEKQYIRDMIKSIIKKELEKIFCKIEEYQVYSSKR